MPRKLSEEKADKIKELSLSGKDFKEIASAVGSSPVTIKRFIDNLNGNGHSEDQVATLVAKKRNGRTSQGITGLQVSTTMDTFLKNVKTFVAAMESFNQFVAANWK